MANDISYEIRESNLRITRQFGLLSKNFKWTGLVPAQRGVSNRGDHNQQQLQASMLVGDSLSNAEGGDAEHDPPPSLPGHPSLHCHKIYLICGRIKLRESEGGSLQGIFLFLSGVVSKISFTISKFCGKCFLGSHEKATQPILKSMQSTMSMDNKLALYVSKME